MATFVLVHGAWHGGWCWEEIVPLLERDGHRVIAPDLPGMGRDRTPLASVTLAGWADFVADLIRAEAQPVVLVGHSRGGIVISEVAERVPERIQRLVYLAAFLAPSGATLRSLAAQSKAPRDPARTVMSEDGLTSTVATHLAGAYFYNHCDAVTIERVAARLTPEPTVSFITPVQLSVERFGSVPRAYIETLQDQALPIDLQRLMQTALPCEPVISLDTDHSPFYSAPEELAMQLERIAAL